VSETAPSEWEQVKRAKLREIDAHRRAIATHENIGHFFESLGLEARAAVVRQRAERAREMLETAIREAKALPIDWSEAFAGSDADQVVEKPRRTARQPIEKLLHRDL
jgi:hypothetical protein